VEEEEEDEEDDDAKEKGGGGAELSGSEMLGREGALRGELGMLPPELFTTPLSSCEFRPFELAAKMLCLISSADGE